MEIKRERSRNRFLGKVWGVGKVRFFSTSMDESIIKQCVPTTDLQETGNELSIC